MSWLASSDAPPVPTTSPREPKTAADTSVPTPRQSPAFMRSRYANWVSGLNGDWLVSRQRFFGVPIPVWYPVDADGEPDYSAPIVPAEADLPVDPAANPPAGAADFARRACATATLPASGCGNTRPSTSTGTVGRLT